MLAELGIRNFAIIDDLRLSFTGGLNVLTGETGAGKSILVDALGMVLGDKAYGEQVRTGADEARIEAVFTGCGDIYTEGLMEKGIIPGEDGSLCIQRRLTRSGRHQAYINGSAVQVGLLSEVGSRLIDIHGQHQHQTLLKAANHIEILDDFGNLEGCRNRFREIFRRFMDLGEKIRKAEEDGKSRESRRDFLAFQKNEIDAAGLSPGEDEELEKKRRMIQNAEKISLLAGEALDLLYEGDTAAAGQVEMASLRLQELSGSLPEAAGAAAGLDECSAMIKDAASSIKDWMRETEYDPDEHNSIEERLDLIGRLKRKYGPSVEEVLQRREALAGEMEDLEKEESMVEEWSGERESLLEEMGRSGMELSRDREAAARKIEKQVLANLAELGMEKARFMIGLMPDLDDSGLLELPGGRFSPWEGGLEHVEMLFSANPGEDLKSLIKVASGGELSRIMLAIKTSLSRVDRVMTLIFDEIDTGIGGSMARTVGRKLKNLSRERQVICVTHLPQIASLADTHFLVSKTVREGKTSVRAVELDPGGRVDEIARMVAGEKVTRAAVEHARELMEER